MYSQSTSESCSVLLKRWEKGLDLTCLEQKQLSGELKALNKQINRLSNRHIRIAAFGRVGVGKSSLLNALIGKNIFATNIAHGFTRKTAGVVWDQSVESLQTIEFIDTPGIDEISANARARLASKAALESDLILLVLDSDMTKIELNALQSLLENSKPILLVLNRCDQWEGKEIQKLVQSIRTRLPASAKKLIIETVAAAPRKAKFFSNGRIRSEECEADVDVLKQRLLNILEEQGNTLLTLNALRQAENFYHILKNGRLKRRKSEAQTLIGKFAALKASGVAVNPLLIFDFATGLALDTALIIQLSKIYGLDVQRHSARKLLKELSINNSLLGGTQIGIQFLLGVIQHILFLATPLTGGLSLAPSAPVALAQAAVAVHTTKLTGRLAAEELLRNSQISGANPQSILRHLIKTNPSIQQYVFRWSMRSNQQCKSMQSLLP
ncbi:Membrane associated GTPase [Prochlorococcus sp. MIT 0603]|nr:Membrane associated GTPase [Prochlorococcus sp. MIT 0603]